MFLTFLSLLLRKKVSACWATYSRFSVTEEKLEQCNGVDGKENQLSGHPDLVFCLQNEKDGANQEKGRAMGIIEVFLCNYNGEKKMKISQALNYATFIENGNNVMVILTLHYGQDEGKELTKSIL